jgi:hypothetical protein
MCIRTKDLNQCYYSGQVPHIGMKELRRGELVEKFSGSSLIEETHQPDIS